MQRGYRLGMKDHRKKRRSEQHVEEEANFIGDILKLLFALSLAIVAIVVCFLFFKNIAGFSLPNLKATEAASESSKEAVVITEATKESKKKKRKPGRKKLRKKARRKKHRPNPRKAIRRVPRNLRRNPEKIPPPKRKAVPPVRVTRKVSGNLPPWRVKAVKRAVRQHRRNLRPVRKAVRVIALMMR